MSKTYVIKNGDCIKTIDDIELEELELVEYILNLKENFIFRYGRIPHYIKIPDYMVKILKNACVNSICEVKTTKEGVQTFNGLILCPTKVIDSVSEIEVF